MAAEICLIRSGWRPVYVMTLLAANGVPWEEGDAGCSWLAPRLRGGGAAARGGQRGEGRRWDAELLRGVGLRRQTDHKIGTGCGVGKGG